MWLEAEAAVSTGQSYQIEQMVLDPRQPETDPGKHCLSGKRKWLKRKQKKKAGAETESTTSRRMMCKDGGATWQIFLDKAIAAISPEKGYRRAVARAALSVMNNGTGYGNYGASHTSRSMRSWHVGGGSAKEDIEDNLETLRKRSRDAYMGIPLAAGAIKTLRTNVVGSGLVPTPAGRCGLSAPDRGTG